MRLQGVRIATTCAFAALGVVPTSAHALTLKADRVETGYIQLTVGDAGGATSVSIAERGAEIGRYTPTNGTVVVRRAAKWSCDRLERSFDAAATYPDTSARVAQASIRTPSCDKRFGLTIRKLRGRIRATVTDRWRLDDANAPLCVRRPGAKPRCRPLPVTKRNRGRRDVSTRQGGGVWRIAVGAATRFAYVRPPGRLRLLATGDSMIQILDADLKARLGKRRVGVRSDARVSTGLSKPFLLNWPTHARQQARRIRPDVTVVAIGANDGFPFGDVDCCGDKWVDAYAKRVRSMMSSYSRDSRGLVYWLTLPAPKPAQWRSIYPAVNRAIKRAAASFAGRVRVVDIAKTFTPHNRFRQYMSWHGSRQNVRAPDGIHLSGAGASIAESLVERALRRDGVV